MVFNIILNLLIFIGASSIAIFLSKINKKLSKDNTSECKFRFSTPQFRKSGSKQYAKFTIKLDKRTRFFIDFPVAFRFYSDSRFSSKVRIKYKTIKTGREAEQIINKLITFNDKTIEYVYRINDIIIGEIEIEIELNTYYGNPIIEFEIMQNDLCKLKHPLKTIIKFPENN